jgi:hypothetical protein
MLFYPEDATLESIVIAEAILEEALTLGHNAIILYTEDHKKGVVVLVEEE